MCIRDRFSLELLHIAGITLQTPSGSSPLGPSSAVEQQRALSEEPTTTRHASDVLDSASFELKLDKSNILMLGPTGTGWHVTCVAIVCMYRLWRWVMHSYIVHQLFCCRLIYALLEIAVSDVNLRQLLLYLTKFLNIIEHTYAIVFP